jgi:hypothetical protein
VIPKLSTDVVDDGRRIVEHVRCGETQEANPHAEQVVLSVVVGS